jgi:hypothetical protein
MCLRNKFYTHQRVWHGSSFSKKIKFVVPHAINLSSSAFSSSIPVVILSGLRSDDRSVQIVLLTCKLNPFLTHSVVKVENNYYLQSEAANNCSDSPDSRIQGS